MGGWFISFFFFSQLSLIAIFSTISAAFLLNWYEAKQLSLLPSSHCLLSFIMLGQFLHFLSQTQGACISLLCCSVINILWDSPCSPVCNLWMFTCDHDAAHRCCTLCVIFYVSVVLLLSVCSVLFLLAHTLVSWHLCVFFACIPSVCAFSCEYAHFVGRIL